MKNPTKAPDISQGGGAFHEKKDKNKRLILVVLLKENHLKQSLLTEISRSKRLKEKKIIIDQIKTV